MVLLLLIPPGGFLGTLVCFQMLQLILVPVSCFAVVVVLSFIVCWLPFHVGRIIYINTEDSQMMYFSQYFNIVALQLFYLSASINPILYNLISKKYRAAAWKLLRGRQPAQRGFCGNRSTEGTAGGDTAGRTETGASLQTPATSMAKQVASSHSSGTSEKTGL